MKYISLVGYLVTFAIPVVQSSSASAQPTERRCEQIAATESTHPNILPFSKDTQLSQRIQLKGCTFGRRAIEVARLDVSSLFFVDQFGAAHMIKRDNQGQLSLIDGSDHEKDIHDATSRSEYKTQNGLGAGARRIENVRYSANEYIGVWKAKDGYIIKYMKDGEQKEPEQILQVKGELVSVAAERALH